MKILCVMLAVAIVLATAFFILKYHILMNLALNARTKNLLAARGNETLSDREQEICIKKSMTDLDTSEKAEGCITLKAYETKVYRE